MISIKTYNSNIISKGRKMWYWKTKDILDFLSRLQEGTKPSIFYGESFQIILSR